MPDYCSETLKPEYKKLEEIQKNFNTQMENLRQQAQNEAVIKKLCSVAVIARSARAV